MPRPCQNFHPRPEDHPACVLCVKHLTEPACRELWDGGAGHAWSARDFGPDEGNPDRGVRRWVGWCQVRTCWDWRVYRDGRVVAEGSEPTEAEARAEADAAAG